MFRPMGGWSTLMMWWRSHKKLIIILKKNAAKPILHVQSYSIARTTTTSPHYECNRKKTHRMINKSRTKNSTHRPPRDDSFLPYNSVVLILLLRFNFKCSRSRWVISASRVRSVQRQKMQSKSCRLKKVQRSERLAIRLNWTVPYTL